MKSPRRIVSSPRKVVRKKVSSPKRRTAKSPPPRRNTSPKIKKWVITTNGGRKTAKSSAKKSSAKSNNIGSLAVQYRHPEYFKTNPLSPPPPPLVLRRQQQQKSQEGIDRWLSPGKFVIFGRKECPWCQKAKELVASKGYDYSFVDMRDPSTGWTKEDTESLMEKTPGFSTVPRVFYGNRFIGGYSDLEKLF